jgi:hypothetical protein
MNGFGTNLGAVFDSALQVVAEPAPAPVMPLDPVPAAPAVAVKEQGLFASMWEAFMSGLRGK